ncbi:MAG TPA: hypothetical protein VIZ90_03615 [Rhizobiaceae bacterium]
MKRRQAILPESLPPVGISREQAAAFVGISASLFDRLVHEGKMPPARALYSRLVWDVAEVTDAFRQIPHRSEPVDASPGDGASWD